MRFPCNVPKGLILKHWYFYNVNLNLSEKDKIKKGSNYFFYDVFNESAKTLMPSVIIISIHCLKDKMLNIISSIKKQFLLINYFFLRMKSI